MKQLTITMMAGLILSGAACGGDDDGGGGDPDAAPADAAGPPEWASVEVLSDEGGIIVERVTYRSGGLLVSGQVCRPDDSGRFPVVVFNHGGFDGLAADPVFAMGVCESTATMQQVWVGSSYRGEDESEGEVEVCLGEVDDVLRMIDIALAQDYTDPDRVIMWGGSHGGCVTTRALQRGAPVHAAVDVFGPTDWAEAHASWVEQIDAKSPDAAFLQEALEVVEEALGGTPDEVPDAYRDRSSLFSVDDMPEGVPFLAAQGVDDPLVPVATRCAFAAAADLESYHLDDAQDETTDPPAGCEDADVTWTDDARPGPQWPGERYFIAYDGLGHNADGAPGQAMLGDVITFLAAKMPQP